MRTLIVSSLLGLSFGCTPRAYCDSVALGQRVPPAAQPAPLHRSWCGDHPAREYKGPASLADTGGEIFSYGEYDAEGTEQCCLYVQDGGVLASWIGYD